MTNLGRTFDAEPPLDDYSDREFELTTKDFSRVREMICRHAGIFLTPTKQSMVYSRLARRLRANGLRKFSDYLDALDSTSSPEWQHFVNALTTNLTSFYREAHHFSALADYLLGLKNRQRIQMWCCAASTGQEPYTMAITAMEAFKSMTPPVRIIATDIDTNVLATATAGIYKDDLVENIPPEILKRYFIKGDGSQDGFYTIRPQVQALISFRPLNLLNNNWRMSPSLDVIFCRNIMIYFEKDVQMQILNRFAPLMNQGGLLFAGHSENFSMARNLFQLRGKTIYEVIADAAFNPIKPSSGFLRINKS
jgi:chemotaxis protein methyltransferase CheR